MKVLSVQQPWASLIVHGLKRCETRGWATLYRGALAIHAARRFRTAQRRLCVQPPIAQLLAAAGISAPAVLPVGCIVGVVTVVDCVPACDVAARIDGLEQQLGE